MIKKIPDQIPVQTGEWHGTTFDIIPKETFGMACRKINEIIAALNPILEERESQIKVYEETMEMVRQNSQSAKIAQGFKNLQDPYAEQRKWVGKLCRFWDDNPKITKHFGILTRIDEKAIVPYEAENGFWYCACEPINPDDDIIFKGE